MFIVNFLTIIFKTPQFDFVLDFLEDSDRQLIDSVVIEGLDKVK